MTNKDEKASTTGGDDVEAGVEIGYEETDLIPVVTGLDAKEGETMKNESMTKTTTEEVSGAQLERESSSTSGGKCWLYSGCCLVLIAIVITLGVVLPKIETGEPLPVATGVGTCEAQDNVISAVENATDGLEMPFPGAEQPNFDNLTIYKTFYEQPELYRTLHFDVIALERGAGNNDGFGFFVTPDAILKVNSEGSDTGSFDAFPIGNHQFRPTKVIKEGNTLFAWNFKGFSHYKRNGTESFKFSMTDEDLLSSTDLLMEFSLAAFDLPEPGEGWVELRRSSDVEPDYDALKGSELLFKIMVTEGPHVSQQEMDDFHVDTDEIDYSEYVLDLKSGDHAVAQSWKQKNETKKAVLWVIGRNDGFQHTHVAKELFFSEDNKMDLYVLNWRANGRCLKYGFVRNPQFASHNPCGDMDIYNEEMKLMLDLIKENGSYDFLLAYGHSTGAPIIMNYVFDTDGDEPFDAYVFNSPFFDWSSEAVGGAHLELVIDNIHNIPTFLKNDFFLDGPYTTPTRFKDTPIIYLGQEIVPSAWHQHHTYWSEWSGRPKFQTALTVGFARAVSDVFEKFKKQKNFITEKPMLVLTSLLDNVLTSSEVVDLSLMVNPNREVAQYRNNPHDVFLSADVADTNVAIAETKEFLRSVVI